MKKPGTYHLIFWLLLLSGLLLRVINLGNYSIWYDEKVSLLSSSGIIETENISNPISAGTWINDYGVAEIKQATIENTSGNSLLYHFTLHYWTKLFGTSDAALRLLSVFFGMLLLCPAYLLAQRTTASKNIALITLAILCFHPLLIEFSREAKSYSMATFFTVWASLEFFRFKDEPVTLNRGLLYTLLCICALMCHYLTAYVFLFHAVAFFLWSFSFKKLPALLGSAILITTAMLTWYAIGGQAGMESMNQRNSKYTERAQHFVEGDDPFYVPATTSNIAKGWFQAVMPITGSQLQKMGFRIREVFMLLIFPLALLVLGWRHRNKGQPIYSFLWIIPLYLLWMTFLSIRSGHCISFQPLYSQFTILFVAIVFAKAFYDSWNSGKWVFTSAIAVAMFFIMCFSSTSSIFDFSYAREPRAKNDVFLLARETEWSNPLQHIIFQNTKDAQLFAIYAAGKQVTIAVDSTLENSVRYELTSGEVVERSLKRY